MVRGAFALSLALALTASCGSEEEAPSGPGSQGGAGEGGAGQAGSGQAGIGATGAAGAGAQGGSGGGAPSFRALGVVFPPPSALTSATSLTVRGTVDPPGSVQALAVAGVDATSEDGFATWLVSVPLDLGNSELNVDVVNAEGEPLRGAAVVPVTRVVAATVEPKQFAVDPIQDRAFTYHPWTFAILETDLASGALRIVTSQPIGSGPVLGPFVAGITYDATNDRLLTIDADALLTVDVATGDRALVASPSVGTGGWPSQPRGIAVDGAQGRAFVSDYTLASIWTIDLVTGNRSILSDAATGTGPPLTSAAGLDIDEAGQRLLVAAGTELVAVELTSGDRTTVSGQFLGSGPVVLANWPSYDATLDRYFVATVDGTVATIDASGDRTVVSDAVTGAGPLLHHPSGLGYSNGHVLVADHGLDGVVAIDPTSGARSLVSGYALGVGPQLEAPREAAFDPANDRVITYDDLEGLVSVGIDGNRTVVSSATVGNGPPLVAPADIEIVGPHALLACLDQVQRVDLTSGDREVVTSQAVGDGAALHGALRAVTLDPSSNSLWAIDLNRILSIDASTGDRTIISDDMIGTGPPIDFLAADLLYDGARLFALRPASILAIDPTSGNRSYLTGGGIGSGTPLGVPSHGMLSDGSMLVGHVAPALYAVDLVSGDRDFFFFGEMAVPAMAPTGWTRSEAGVVYWLDGRYGALLAIDPMTTEVVVVSK
jgi:hypothetical protein